LMTQPDAPVNGIHAGIAAVINEIDVAVYRFAAGGPCTMVCAGSINDRGTD